MVYVEEDLARRRESESKDFRRAFKDVAQLQASSLGEEFSTIFGANTASGFLRSIFIRAPFKFVIRALRSQSPPSTTCQASKVHSVADFQRYVLKLPCLISFLIVKQSAENLLPIVGMNNIYLSLSTNDPLIMMWVSTHNM